MIARCIPFSLPIYLLAFNLGLAQELTPVYLLSNVVCVDLNTPAQWNKVVDCLAPWIALEAYKQRKILPEFQNSSALLDPTLKVMNNGGQKGQGLSITATAQLLADPKPNIMLGNSWSSVSLASNAFMSTVKELQLGYSSTNAKLSNKILYPYFMRVIAPDALQSRALAKVLLELNYTQVTCLYAEEGYSEGLALDFRKYAQEGGVSVSMYSLPHDLYEDWPAVMANAFAEGNRVYVVEFVSAAVPVFWREAAKIGIASKDTVVIGGANMALHVGPETYGTIGVRTVSKGPMWPQFLEFWKTFRLADLPDDIRNKADASGYTDENFKNGDLPRGAYVPFAVDNMFAALLAMEGLAQKGVPSDEIRSDILKDEMYALTFRGVTGPVAFDENGDRLGDYEIYNHVKVGEEVQLEIVGLCGSSAVKFDKHPTFPDGTTNPTPQRSPKCPAGTFGPGMPHCEYCIPGTANKVLGAQACIPCDRGFYTAASGALQCSLCPAGSEQPLEGQPNCANCRHGFFGRFPGQPECEPCEPGFFSGANATECTPCAIGTFVSSPGSSTCTACPDTYTTAYRAALRGEECTCAEGTFWNRAADKCDPCQPECFCSGGLETPVVYEGFYARFSPPESGDAALLAAEETSKRNGTYEPRSNAFTNLIIWKCAGKLQCPRNSRLAEQFAELSGRGGIYHGTSVSVMGLHEPNVCPPGREDIACAVCAADRYGPMCSPCEGQLAFGVFIVALLIFPLAMFLIAAWYRDCDYEAKADVYFVIGGMVGVLLVYGQCIGIMSNMSIDWHPAVTPTMEMSRAIFLLDFGDAVTMCVTGTSFLAQYWQAFCVPLLVVAAMFFAQGMSRVLPNVCGHDLAIRRECSCNVVGSILAALYVYMVQSTTAFFECVPNPVPEATPTLAKYKQIECGSDRHAEGTAPMVLGVLVYVIGFFVLCLVLTFIAPRRFHSRSFRECVYFLVYRWKPAMWYFNLVYMVRNVGLASINSMSKDGGTQLVLMGSVLLVFTIMMCLSRPWKSPTLSYVDALSSMMLITLLFFGYSALFCGEKIRNLLLIGMLDRALEWEEFIEKFTLAMIYTNVVLGVGVAVLLAQMGNELRPSVQARERELERLEMHHLCKIIEDMYDHPDFGATLKRTIESANTEDTSAMKAFVSTIVHRLGDANLVMRADDCLGGVLRLERGSSRVGSVSASALFMRLTRAMSSKTRGLQSSTVGASTPGSLMKQVSRKVTLEKEIARQATAEEGANNMPNTPARAASVVPVHSVSPP